MADQIEPTASNGDSKQGIRVLIGLLAVAVIAFCAWSMSEYAHGRDPLAAIFGSSVQETGADPQEGAAGDDAAEPASSDATLSAQEVEAALAGLQFDGQDVSVASDHVKVVVHDGSAWIEQTTDASPAALVEETAQRSVALSAWLADQGFGQGDVTWVTEDSNGVIRMVACLPSGVSARGDVATILGQAKGYLISAATFAQLEQPAFDRTSGEAPTLPDGVALAVDAVVSPGDADGGAGEKTTIRLVEVVSAGDGASSADGATPLGTKSTATASTDDGTISVSVSISGTSYTVRVSRGATAYDALLATGASVNVGSNPVPFGSGVWVYGINGVDQDDSHGWVYAVNGSSPSVMSDQYALSAGDAVVWSFVSY